MASAIEKSEELIDALTAYKRQPGVIGKVMITECPYYKDVHVGEDLSGVTSLIVFGDDTLVAIRSVADQLLKLEYLDVHGCQTELPVLPALVRIKLKQCGKEFIRSISKSSSVRSIRIDVCDVDVIPIELRRLVNLEKLRLYKCQELVEIPDIFGDLPNMKDLTLSSCGKLKSVPPSISAYAGLEVLISLCRSFAPIPDQWKLTSHIESCIPSELSDADFGIYVYKVESL